MQETYKLKTTLILLMNQAEKEYKKQSDAAPELFIRYLKIILESLSESARDTLLLEFKLRLTQSV